MDIELLGHECLPHIRVLTNLDDLKRLTRLIHAAYAPHAAGGLRFWGTHQTDQDTAQRFALGQGFVAVLRGEYVGTITVRPPQPTSPVSLYRQAHIWSISQFAVAPECKGTGLGKALHQVAIAHAMRHGATAIALDTAEGAQGLIDMYRAWGYEFAGQHDWRPQTNYLSVLMKRPV